MGNLTTLERNLPLRAYPEQELNNLIVTVLMPYISKLLSLKDETSAERLEMALPAIKEQCISMGFSDIKKMFDMYADSKLSIEPRTNFFDRILFGKIVIEYRSRNRPMAKPQNKITEAEKTTIENNAIQRVKEFFQDKRYIEDNDFFIYDIFEHRGLIKLTREEKEDIAKDAKEIMISNLSKKKASTKKEHGEIKDLISKINANNRNVLKNKCKVLALEDYFRKTLKL